jgi:hypothetical protein
MLVDPPGQEANESELYRGELYQQNVPSSFAHVILPYGVPSGVRPSC